jgi:hypothetical protein
MFPDWNDDLAIPTVDDRIFIGDFEITINKPQQSRQVKLVVEPASASGLMSERGKAVSAILKRTHVTTAEFLNKILNPELIAGDIEDLRVDLKNLLENNRSALEYVAHYMAARCSPQPRTKDVKFPVSNSSDNSVTFAQKLNRWFPGLTSSRPALEDYLISIQPFNPDQWLHRLSELTNFNKHHSLSVWESSVFQSIIIRVEDNAIRIGELGFQSIDLNTNGKLIFQTKHGIDAEVAGPCIIDVTTSKIPGCDERILFEKHQVELHNIRGASHSIAHEVWSLSKNVFRAVNNICSLLSTP